MEPVRTLGSYQRVSNSAGFPLRSGSKAGLNQGSALPKVISLPAGRAAMFGATRGPLFGTGENNDPEERVTVPLNLLQGWYENLRAAAIREGLSVEEKLVQALPQFLEKPPEKKIIPSVTDVVTGYNQVNGRKMPVTTQVKSLMGPDQIFDQWLETLDKTERYAQISLYDFDNLAVEGGRSPAGADAYPAWKKQQDVLQKIVEKARQGVRFQILLDSSVEYRYDEYGDPIFPRKINNRGMVEYLRKLQREEGLPIEVAAYPRQLANMYHVKLLVADGDKAIVSGMNLSNHSAANWDAGVSLQGPEVANVQAETFHQDWVVSRLRNNPAVSRQEVDRELPAVQPVSHPAIRVLNTMPKEYARYGFKPREDVADYWREKLDAPDLSGIFGEQFIMTHIPTAKKLKELQKKIPIRFLQSSGVERQFPYTRNIVAYLNQGREEMVGYYKEFGPTGEQLHAKWTGFESKHGDDELLIGSTNLSAAGTETYTGKQGPRLDYPSGKKRPYRRGNRDLAVVIPSRKITGAFKQQFNDDWENRFAAKPPGYGLDLLSRDVSMVPPEEVARQLDELG